MIAQYRFILKEDSGRPLPSFWAYRLYAWLLTQVDEGYADVLHAPGEKPISQYLYRDKQTQEDIWVVNLLCEETKQMFGGVLESLTEIPLHTGVLQARCETVLTRTAEQIAVDARSEEDRRRTTLQFLTPAAFKSGGRYAIFPQERWLIQTMAAKWNACFPEMPMDDADALAALERGINITDYALHTTRYPLKNIKIPGFVGAITMESRLAAPMEEIWQLLLEFARYAGVGIKTTLGMGAVEKLDRMAE